MEEWRPVVGWEGIYEVSSLGTIKRILDSGSARAGAIRKLAFRGRGGGTLQLAQDGRRINYKAHRLVAAAFLSDYDEDLQVDHRDGDVTNNRATNLRMATGAQNQMNKKKPKSNTSGAKGVYYEKRTGKYIARITVEKRQIFIGQWTELEPARQAYELAAAQHFGAFARENVNGAH